MVQHHQYGPDGRPLTRKSFPRNCSKFSNTRPKRGLITEFSTSTSGNTGPASTYTYVGEVDSILNNTAYGQAVRHHQQQRQQQQQQRNSDVHRQSKVGSTYSGVPPSVPQPRGSPQPIIPQQTGSSVPSTHTHSTQVPYQPPLPEQFQVAPYKQY